MLGRVPRRVPRGDDRFADREGVAVLHLLSIKAITRAAIVAGKYLRRINLRTEFTGAAHEVSVNVRFEDMRDRKIILPGHLEILVDVRRGIEDRRDSLAVVSDQVREFGDSVGLDSFKN